MKKSETMSKPTVEQIAQWNDDFEDQFPANGDYINRDGLKVGYLAARHKAFEEYSKEIATYKFAYENQVRAKERQRDLLREISKAGYFQEKISPFITEVTLD